MEHENNNSSSSKENPSNNIKSSSSTSNNPSSHSPPNLIYGLSKEVFSNHISNFTKEIQSINNSSFKNYKEAFHFYYLLEKKLKNTLFELKFTKNQRHFFKKFIEDNLYENLIQLQDRIDICSVKERIISYFNNFLDDFAKVKDLNEYFGINIQYSKIHIETNETERLVVILKEMEKSFYIQFYSYLCLQLIVDKIPEFLLAKQKKIINEKVRKIWKLKYEIPVNQLKIESKYEYVYLRDLFLDFINEKPNSNIFDENVFNERLGLA